jgi:membrane-associated phospholipid phosphatase
LDWALILKKILIIIFVAQLLFLLFALYTTNQFFYQSYLIMGLCVFLWFSRKKLPIFIQHIIIFILLMWFNYDLTGAINKAYGGFPLKDAFFSNFDIGLWGKPVADMFIGLPLIFFDLVMLAYVFYYLLPFLVILDKREKAKKLLLYYTESVTLFLLVSYILYLAVPVTGPQYYLADFFRGRSLEFTSFGGGIYHLIATLHPNRIDCFPSVHTGLGSLATLWAFELKASPFLKWGLAFIMVLIILATLSLRYHYTLDVVVGFALSVMSFLFCKVRMKKFQ